MSVPATVSHAISITPSPASRMLVVTTPDVPGYRIVRVLGMARGSTVRTRHIGVDLLAGLRNLVGGEVVGYTTMLAQSREQAIDRMCADALSHGANAIVAARLSTASVMAGAAEMLAYGTAVVIEPN